MRKRLAQASALNRTPMSASMARHCGWRAMLILRYSIDAHRAASHTPVNWAASAVCSPACTHTMFNPLTACTQPAIQLHSLECMQQMQHTLETQRATYNPSGKHQLHSAVLLPKYNRHVVITFLAKRSFDSDREEVPESACEGSGRNKTHSRAPSAQS